jgi:hypothetical protein
MTNFEELLQAELDKLPFEKGLDDGQYNDGKLAGFEMGARWANEKIIEDLEAENTKLIVKIKMQREQLITQNEYIDRMDMLARKGRERRVEG